MIGPLSKITRTSNYFKNVLIYFGKVWRKSNFCIWLFDWLISLYLLSLLTCNASFLTVKNSCVREEHSDVVFFFQRSFNKLICKKIFLVISHSRPLPLVRAPTQLTLFPSPTTCAVENFQCLRFGNSQSTNKFTGNPKIVCHLKISQENLKHKSMVKFTLRTIYPYTRSLALRIVTSRGGKRFETDDRK